MCRGVWGPAVFPALVVGDGHQAPLSLATNIMACTQCVVHANGSPRATIVMNLAMSSGACVNDCECMPHQKSL